MSLKLFFTMSIVKKPIQWYTSITITKTKGGALCVQQYPGTMETTTLAEIETLNIPIGKLLPSPPETTLSAFE
jgi:hypothetical protein